MKQRPATRKAPVKQKNTTSANLDLDPDAWPKFEALVKSAAKMGHKPHAKKARERRPKR
jgi:hypothetical protein